MSNIPPEAAAKPAECLAATERLALGALDALAAHICVLDAGGGILLVNRAWREFAAANSASPADIAGVGRNYYAACESGNGPDAALAREAVAGLRAVAAGALPEFILEYPCHSPQARRWFELRATRFPGAGPARLVAAHTDITSRKLAENSFTRQNLLHRQLVQTIPSGIQVVDLAGTIVMANRGYHQLYGYADGELIGKNLFDLQTSAVERERLKNYWAGIATGQAQPEPYEAEVPCKDGATVFVHVVWDYQRDYAGRATGFLANVVDITAHKQSEEALRESRHLLQTVMDLLPHFIFVKDRQSRHLLVNRACAAAHGRLPQQMVGLSDLDLGLDPAEAAAFMRDDREVIDSGQRKDVAEEVLTAGAGEPRYLHTIKMPFTAPGGVPALLGVAVDITERKKAETALRASEARMRAIAANTPDLIFIQDRELRYRMIINPQLGLTEGEILGRTDRDLLPAEAAEKLTAIKRRVVEAGETVRVEVPLVSRQGETEHFDGTYVPTLDAQGKVDGLIGYFRKVTEQKKMESALRALAARLESVREEERQHLAREIHDTFGHALTDWKLDLAWLGRRLAEAGLNGRTAIRRKVAAMSHRAEGEMDTVRRIAGALRPVLLDTVGLASAIAWHATEFEDRTGIRCRLELPPGLAAIPADRATAAFRILQELLANVVRHARAELVEIRLQTEGGWLELRVQDNGAGIPESAAASPASLGLLGIRERAGALGGTVDIRGVAGQGTTACVRLPLAAPPGAEGGGG